MTERGARPVELWEPDETAVRELGRPDDAVMIVDAQVAEMPRPLKPDAYLQAVFDDPAMSLPLERLFMLLPPARSRLLHMRYVDGGWTSLRACAQELGCTPGTAKAALSKAKAQAVKFLPAIADGSFDYEDFAKINFQTVRNVLGFLSQCRLTPLCPS